MKLIRSVRALEELKLSGEVPGSAKKIRKRAASLAPPGSVVGLVWTVDEVRLGRPLASGEFLALDVFRVGVRAGGAGSQRTVERVTSDPRDLGFVYGADGVLVGRVVRRNGSLVTTEIGVVAGV